MAIARLAGTYWTRKNRTTTGSQPATGVPREHSCQTFRPSAAMLQLPRLQPIPPHAIPPQLADGLRHEFMMAAAIRASARQSLVGKPSQAVCFSLAQRRERA